MSSDIKLASTVPEAPKYSKRCVFVKQIPTVLSNEMKLLRLQENTSQTTVSYPFHSLEDGGNKMDRNVLTRYVEVVTLLHCWQ